MGTIKVLNSMVALLSLNVDISNASENSSKLFFDVFRENRVFIYVDILKCKKEDRKETKFFIITFTPLRQGLPLPFLWNKQRFRYILSL